MVREHHGVRGDRSDFILHVSGGIWRIAGVVGKELNELEMEGRMKKGRGEWEE